jgi:hypothetical protein
MTQVVEHLYKALSLIFSTHTPHTQKGICMLLKIAKS